MEALPYLECPPLGGDAYGQWFTDAAVWRPYVDLVARRHRLPAPGEVAVPPPGSHPVFRAAAGYFVKFYAPHWPESFAAEAGVYAALGEDAGLPVPHLLASGRLFAGEPGGRWAWPYLVTSMVAGRSATELAGRLSAHDLRAVARALAPPVRALHRRPLPAGASAGWRDRITRFAAAAQDRRREGGWAQSMVMRVPAYLRAVLGEAAALPPRLVHGDLTGDHVLLVPDRWPARWRLSGVIDFADALVGDPAYELVALYFDLLRGDAAALQAFLDAYGPDPAWGDGCRRRATAYVLLFPFEVLGTLRERVPDVDAAAAPEDLEAELWPAWLR